MSRKIIIALIGAAVVMAAGCSKNTQGNVNGGNARNEASLEEGSETLNETLRVWVDRIMRLMRQSDRKERR